MPRATARFAKLTGKAGYFAEVTITIERTTSPSVITTNCAGAGFFSQGYVESVPDVGYDDWKKGAVLGARYALSVTNVANCAVEITEICGFSTDTNPSIVATACALAVWSALGVEAPPDARKLLDTVALTSWERAPDSLPEL